MILDKIMMMDITQEELVNAGYNLQSAAPDAWRTYDRANPVPNYFDFDWFSARHPDLYHKFALSTDGLMSELATLLDLSGLHVLDCGAGTGRSTIGAAKKARQVTALDVFASTLSYGKLMVSKANFKNVSYTIGISSNLPFPDNTFDAALCAWSILDYPEAHRVLKPGGTIVELGPAPGALCGGLSALLAGVYPDLITEVAPPELFEARYPESDMLLEDAVYNGVQVVPPTLLHDFTYVADYGDYQEAAAIWGRLYGPIARQYLKDRQQSTVAWRLRIAISRVRK